MKNQNFVSFVFTAIFGLCLFQSCQKNDELANDVATYADLREELTEYDLEVHDHTNCCSHSFFDDSLEMRIGFIGADTIMYQVTEAGTYLIDGDIAVPKEMIAEAPTQEGEITDRAAFLPSLNTWTNGIVYYKFAPSLPQAQRNAFLKACQKWNQYTGIQFIYRTNQPNYIYVIKDGNKDYSSLGMVGGYQYLSLSDTNLGVAMHELGHALGLVHEHQRGDRDSKIWVHPYVANTGNFQKYYTYNYGTFDWNSIMLYGSAPINENSYTMLKKPNYVPFINTIEYWRNQGSYALPSTKDINCIKYLY